MLLFVFFILYCFKHLFVWNLLYKYNILLYICKHIHKMKSDYDIHPLSTELEDLQFCWDLIVPYVNNELWLHWNCTGYLSCWSDISSCSTTAMFLSVLWCVPCLLMLAAACITWQCLNKDLIIVIHFFIQAVSCYFRDQITCVCELRCSRWCKWGFCSSRI